ncbi:PAS domain S-box protein [Ramlibacter sp. AW1]|uniref:histidine kinase n=1 Tax=Ramlibacter aurantiacus TaxID=2801330 RepID=A0A936ZI67_9BURK|nr:ATP-binding protein [Ramlibacter aurantiacus]MBL0421362.1 PAS domain S-box protein [Ramlibacter aurantiacus]
MSLTTSRSGRWTVRTYLIWLVLACLLPGVLGALALFGHQYRQSRAELDKSTMLTARALAQATDNHLLKVQAVAQSLATSAALPSGDLARFHQQGREVLSQVGLGSHLVLRDAQGRQLLNTALARDVALPDTPEPARVEAVLGTGQPAISNLQPGSELPLSGMSVDVPVHVAGELRYVLSIKVPVQRFQQMLQSQGLPPDWFAAVFDGQGTLVARAQAPDEFVGRKVAAGLARQLEQGAEGSGEFTTLDGVPVFSYFSRSPQTGWGVAIGIPRAALIDDMARTSALLGAGIVVLFGAGLMLARLIGRGISRSFQALSDAAGELGAGHEIDVPDMHIREADAVATALSSASRLLRERSATLRESEMRFKALADNIAQLAWMTDRHGAFQWFNRRWFEFTGMSVGEAAAGSWGRYHHPDHRDRALEKFRRHVESGSPWEDTFPLRGRDGSYRWFLSRAFPLRDPSGRIVSWFGTNTDITEQLDAQQALHEADRRKDEFIALLAHELRNPLAPVRTAVEILRRLGGDEPRHDRARAVIERQVGHMARLIDDLLDVSRIARGKLALQKERCDLAAVARQTADDYRPSLETAGLRLHVRTAPQPIWVDGDPVRLAQMIGNLLNNAGRFTERGGQVEVHVEADAGRRMAMVRVVDTGVGMDAELMQRLFDPFSQARQDLARSKGGLGLGLALTKGLVELHGGGVAVDSDGVGHGSTFTLRLPLAHSQQLDCAQAVDRLLPGQKALRVLVIEDNEDAARSLGELLEMNGHEVKLAFDGESGVVAAHQFRPDVVISDIGLPGEIDGYGVAQALRASDALRHTCLIALSGYANDQARRRSSAAGFDVHLAKPADIQILERTLASL